jgi:hypothetical protein
VLVSELLAMRECQPALQQPTLQIGLGRAHKGRPVKLLIADQNIRVTDLQGQLIHELTLDPDRIHPRTPSHVYHVPRHQSPTSRHITQSG